MSKKLEILIAGKDQLSPAAKSAENSLNGLGNAAKSADGKTGGLWKQMAGGVLVAQAVTAAAGAASRAIVEFISSSVDAYNESAKAEAQLAAALKSTGGAAGLTAQELKKYASEMQSMTAYEDDAVISSQAMLLTFTSIGKDTFPAATKAILDLSQAMGQDLKSSTVQIGKALNEPIQGISALQRVGIQFTESQKDMIKGFVDMGEASKAQGVILDELNRQFGGSAEAFAKTTQGMWIQTKNIIGDIKEVFGEALMNTLLPMMEQLKKWIEENREEIDRFAKKAAEALGEFVVAIKDLILWIIKWKDEIIVVAGVMATVWAVGKISIWKDAALSALSAVKTGWLGLPLAVGLYAKAVSTGNDAAMGYLSAQADAYKKIYDLRDKALQIVPDAMNAAMKKGAEDAKNAEAQRHQDFLRQVQERGARLSAAYEKEYADQVKIETQIKKVNQEIKILGMTDPFKHFRPERIDPMVSAVNGIVDAQMEYLNDNPLVLDGMDKMAVKSKKTVDTWSELNAKAEMFGRAGQEIIGALDAMGVKSGKLGSLFGTAVGSATGAFSGMSMFNAGKDEGGFEGFLGQAAGIASLVSSGLSLLSGVADFLGFTRTGIDDTVDRLAMMGVSIDENLIKKLEEAREAGKDVGAETAKMTADIISQNEVTGQNFSTLNNLVRDVFMQFDNGRLSVQEATKAYGEAFDALAKGAEKAGMAGNEALANLIRDARTRGMVGQEMLGYIDPERAKGLQAMAAHVRGTSDTEAGFQAAMSQTMAFYASMIADGKGVVEILDSIGPALDQLKTTGTEKGYDTGYLAELLGMRDFIEKNKDVIDSIQATQTVMDSMAKTGILTQEAFTGFAANALDYYNKLTAEGKNGKEAIQALLPMLGKQLWYAEQYGFELDENTKKLIEEAKAQGLKLDAAIPAEEKMLAVLEKILEAFNRLTGGIDSAAAAVGRLGAGIEGLPKGDWEDEGSSPSTPQYATGTNWRPIPRWFISGEFAQETIETRGGMMRVTPGNGRAGGIGGEVTINLNIPNLRDPYSAEALKQDIRLNRAGIRTELERLAVN